MAENVVAQLRAHLIRRATLTERLKNAQSKRDALVHQIELQDEAVILLAELAETRRLTVIKHVSQSASAAAELVFGEGNRVEVTTDGKIVVTCGAFSGSLASSEGRSMINIMAFCLWLELLWLYTRQGKATARIVLWDEPFLNVNPDLMPLTADLFRGCANLGVQVIQATNHPQMILPDSTVIQLHGRRTDEADLASGEPAAQASGQS